MRFFIARLFLSIFHLSTILSRSSVQRSHRDHIFIDRVDTVTLLEPTMAVRLVLTDHDVIERSAELAGPLLALPIQRSTLTHGLCAIVLDRQKAGLAVLLRARIIV